MILEWHVEIKVILGTEVEKQYKVRAELSEKKESATITSVQVNELIMEPENGAMS